MREIEMEQRREEENEMPITEEELFNQIKEDERGNQETEPDSN